VTASFLWLVGARVYILAQRGEYVGPLMIWDRILDVGLVLAVLLICAAVGLWLLNRFHSAVDLEPLETLLFSTALGGGCFAMSVLILGFLSALRPIPIAILIVFWAFAAKCDIPRIWDLAKRASTDLKSQSSILTRSILGLVAVFMVSQALLPPQDWDSLMYHLRVPAQFIQSGKIFVPEDNLHTAYVQLIHMLYAPLLAFGGTSGPALLSVSFAFLLGLAVFAFGRRFFDSDTAGFAIQLLWGSTILLLVAITPRIDVTFSLFLFLAHFALLLATMQWKLFFLAAALLGFSVGIKHTAVIYALALGPVVFWVSGSRKRGVWKTLSDLSWFALISLGAALPWLAKNWWLFQAPFYPIFAERRIDPWLAFLYPETVLPPSLDSNALTMLAEVRLPFNIVDLFLSPGNLSVEAEAVFYQFSPLFVILIVWVTSLKKKAIQNALVLPPLAYLVMLTAFLPRTNLRYLIPVIAPLTVASVYEFVSRVVSRYRTRMMTVLVYLVVFFVLFPAAKVMTVWTAGRLDLGYLAGKVSLDDYLYRVRFPADYAILAPTVAHVNETLPPTSRVLMLFEARGFYFRVPVIQDNVLTNWPLLAHRSSELGCLAGSRITHVLLNSGAVDYYLARGLSRSTLQWKVFQKFADQCLIRIFESPAYVLYEVRKG
jgi:4-amino-4-deoxy-L-arabinose transferase-like glycosyltransferase